MTHDEEAIRALGEQMARAEEACDAVFFEQVLADDIVIMPPNTPALVGRDACLHFIRTVLEENAPEIHNRLSPEISEIAVHGDLAFDRGSFTQSLITKDGGEATGERGQFLRLYRRDQSGTWKLGRVIWNRLDETESEGPPAGPDESRLEHQVEDASVEGLEGADAAPLGDDPFRARPDEKEGSCA